MQFTFLFFLSGRPRIKPLIKPFPQIPRTVQRCTPPVPFFTDEVLSAVKVGAGVLVLGVMFGNRGIAVKASCAGVVGLAGHGDQALLPGFVLDVSRDAPSDKVVGCFAKLGLFRLIEAFFELGQDDEFGALFEGVVDNLSAYLMGVVVGDAGYFFIIFRIWTMLLRNAEGSVPYSMRHTVPSNAAFGITQKQLPTVGQFFSALDKIWGGGATVCFNGGTNCKAVRTGEGHGNKLFVLFYALFGGPAVFHDLLDGDVDHDFFLFDDNGRAHELGVFWKGSASITVLDPGPGFAGVELKQYAFLVKIFVHAFVVEHGHM